MKLTTNSNPTLFDLLKSGSTVILPDGKRYLRGDTDDGYISLGFVDDDGSYISLGCYNLSREGLRNAMSDRDFRALGNA